MTSILTFKLSTEVMTARNGKISEAF